jgi:hypothetical protein
VFSLESIIKRVSLILLTFLAYLKGKPNKDKVMIRVLACSIMLKTLARKKIISVPFDHSIIGKKW